MSALSRFMHAARTILEDPERMPPSPDRPPVLVRTTWLFAEIDEANEQLVKLSHAAKIARLQANLAEARRLTAEMARVSRQITQLCAWAEEQFQKEQPNAR